MFGSDICTCRPYLTFGIEEAVKEAQKGGSGVVIYFRKEGRALGEVGFHGQFYEKKRMLTAIGHKIPCLQRKKTWRRPCKRILQAHREHRRSQGHAFRKYRRHTQHESTVTRLFSTSALCAEFESDSGICCGYDCVSFCL